MTHSNHEPRSIPLTEYIFFQQSSPNGQRKIWGMDFGEILIKIAENSDFY
jgi:hypothetical protein